MSEFQCLRWLSLIFMLIFSKKRSSGSLVESMILILHVSECIFTRKLNPNKYSGNLIEITIQECKPCKQIKTEDDYHNVEMDPVD